jgi:Mycobacterium membrane protein
MIGTASRLWMPFAIACVVALGAFYVDRLLAMSGGTETIRDGNGMANTLQPFDAGRVTYGVFSDAAAVVTVNSLAPSAQPPEVSDGSVPLLITLTTAAPAASAIIPTQDDSLAVGCKIIVTGQVTYGEASNEVTAQTFCWVKSA